MGTLNNGFAESGTLRAEIHATLVVQWAMSARAIAAACDMPLPRVAVTLTKMKAAGLVTSPARETWEAVPPEQWPETRGKHRVRRFGEKARSWRGGRFVNEEGYVLIHVGKGAPMADVRGYVYEHRLVMSRILGRTLLSSEQVHHKDENRQNNDPANLEVLSIAEHKVRHRSSDCGRRLPGEDNPVVACCCGCGATFEKFDEYGRPRKCVPGHNRTGQRRSA